MTISRHSQNSAFVFQGGGALGAYLAGVYQALTEAGHLPDQIAGISIGAINTAIIADNPPAARIEKLRAFWNMVSSRVAASAFFPAWPSLCWLRRRWA
jgi:NTE family protein